MTGLWVLIVFAHAGFASKSDSMALATVDGFSSQSACELAGKQAMSLGKGTTKDVKFVCVAR